MFKRPGFLRMETVNVFGMPSLIFISDSERLKVFDAKKNEFYKGRASKKNVMKLLGVKLDTKSIISIFSGVGFHTHSYIPIKAVLDSDGEKYILQSEKGADIIFKELLFGKEKKNLLLMKEYDGQGRLIREVSYGDFREQEGILIPYRISAVFHLDGVSVTLEYRDVEINRNVNDAVFEFAPPAGTSEIDLDDME